MFLEVVLDRHEEKYSIKLIDKLNRVQTYLKPQFSVCWR